MRHRRAIPVTAALFFTTAAALAQDGITRSSDTPGVTISDDGNRVIYERAYFEQYNVINASDQLNRIPGIQEALRGGGGGRRGFGSSGDQVLINGKRVSGKSNSVGDVLDRIQARQVVRVEVIRGTVADLDVRSQGLVVNVILEDTLVTGYGSWQASAEKRDGRPLSPGVELSYNGDVGALNYLMSLEADKRHGRNTRTDRFFTPEGRLFERQDERGRGESEDYTLSANTTYTFGNGDILNLNGRYGREERSGEEISDRFQVTTEQETLEREVLTRDAGSSRDWELGGDWEHAFTGGRSLNALFVYTHDSGEWRNTFASAPAGGETEVDDIQVQNRESTEKILRASYRWGLSQTHSFESGAEMAVNTRDQHARLYEDAGGILQEVSLFNQESRVEETRYEAFTAYTWQARPSLLVEGSLDVEYSELGQEGRDVSRTRDFFFTRPRLVLRYDITSLTQLRSRIERTVSQLNFGAFVASFTDDDNRSNVISAGNPELVPEKAWEYELTYEYRLPNDMGVVSVSGNYRDIQDRIGRIPLTISTAEGSLVERTAPGNIGDGYSLGLSLDGSLRLDRFNLSGAVIEGSVEVDDSNITDPFTGEDRDFNWQSPYRWRLEFRHDTDWHNLSYGLRTGKQGPSRRFDRDYWEERRREADMRIFAEIQPIDDLTMRLSVREVLRADRERDRYQYAGNRGDSVLERREYRFSRPFRRVSFSVEGIF